MASVGLAIPSNRPLVFNLVDLPRWSGVALNRRAFTRLLLISISAHLALLAILADYWFDGAWRLDKHANPSHTAIQIAFERPLSKQTTDNADYAPSKLPAPAELLDYSTPAVSATKPAQPLPMPPDESAVSDTKLFRQPATPLSRSREVITAVARDIARESAAEKTTATGAVIMRPELLALVQAAPRRLGIAGDEASALPNASYQGGSWISVVERDGQCFQVHSADPLTPGSMDMWYMIDC